MKKSKVREDALKYRYNSPDDVVIGDQVSKGERVKDISFDVKKNQILAILGPERSGKSSLLDIISTLSSFDSGDISI